MSHLITEEQIAEFKEAFQLFDKDGDGYILTQELGTVMRVMGSNPTQAQLEDIMIYLGDEGMDFSKFLSLMARMRKENDFETELLQAFKSFDKNGTGIISINDFRQSLLKLQQQLTVEETIEMIELAEPLQDGTINYQNFLSKMISQ